MMTELKPCPFCGVDNELELIAYNFYDIGIYRAMIVCNHCNVIFKLCDEGARTQELIEQEIAEAWNTRVGDGE